MDLSEYVLEPVHADGALALYRGRGRVPDSSILSIRPVSEHPAPATLKRLGHEYSLAGELHSAWAARPVALTEHEGRTTPARPVPGTAAGWSATHRPARKGTAGCQNRSYRTPIRSLNLLRPPN